MGDPGHGVLGGMGAGPVGQHLAVPDVEDLPGHAVLPVLDLPPHLLVQLGQSLLGLLHLLLHFDLDLDQGQGLDRLLGGVGGLLDSLLGGVGGLLGVLFWVHVCFMIVSFPRRVSRLGGLSFF